MNSIVATWYVVATNFAGAVLGDPGSIGYQGVNDPQASTNSLLNTFFFWAGVAAMAVLVIAAFVYVTSQGDSSKVAQAKNAIIGAVAGVVLVILSAAIFNMVVELGQ